MLAVSVDNLLFFLLIAGAALFQLLSKAVTKAGKNQSDKTSPSPTPQRPPQVRRAQKESDADRIRKFLEALGQPPTSSPPPPVVPRTDFPPRPLAPVQAPTVMPRPWGLSREQRTKPDTTRRGSPPPELPSGVAEIFPPAVPAAAPFEVHKAPLRVEFEQPPSIKASVEAVAADTRPVAKGADFKSDIATSLGSKSGLREAIILREIFGPPRGLQAFDLL
jgi:hypothetical protein